MSTEHRAGSSLSSSQSLSWGEALFFGLGALVTALAAWTAVGLWIWPQRDPPPTTAPSLIIALGAGVTPDSLLNPIGAERLRTAIDYMRQSGASRLVTTRVRDRRSGVLSDRGQRLIIAEAGLLDRWTTLAGVATSTRDEAMGLSAIAPPGASIVVVTSRLHTRRACSAFRHLGFRVTCVSSPHDGSWWSTPYHIAYEMLGVFKYELRGWM